MEVLWVMLVPNGNTHSRNISNQCTELFPIIGNRTVWIVQPVTLYVKHQCYKRQILSAAELLLLLRIPSLLYGTCVFTTGCVILKYPEHFTTLLSTEAFVLSVSICCGHIYKLWFSFPRKLSLNERFWFISRVLRSTWRPLSWPTVSLWSQSQVRCYH